jgi:FkbM family methyltransferase
MKSEARKRKPSFDIWCRFYYRHWTFQQVLLGCLAVVSQKFSCFHTFFQNCYANYAYKRLLVQENNKEYLKIGEGARGKHEIKLSPLHTVQEKEIIRSFLDDTFYSHLYLNDNYSKLVWQKMDRFLWEGPYEYEDEHHKVRLCSGDVVIDVGAWIGDFSALAAYKGATVYAFEPTKQSYELLCKTAELNKDLSGKIIPVCMGLGDTCGEAFFCQIDGNSGFNKIVTDYNNSAQVETTSILLTALDEWVEKNNIERVDFIKADIEGYERNLLWGAKNTIRKFSPKIAICTYHLPDDPEVLESIIKEINPNYIVSHTKAKLFASVNDSL